MRKFLNFTGSHIKLNKTNVPQTSENYLAPSILNWVLTFSRLCIRIIIPSNGCMIIFLHLDSVRRQMPSKRKLQLQYSVCCAFFMWVCVHCSFLKHQCILQVILHFLPFRPVGTICLQTLLSCSLGCDLLLLLFIFIITASLPLDLVYIYTLN